MNFCQTYFSKDLDDLTAEDLIHFFKFPQKESQYLEFKSTREPNMDKVFSNTLKPCICSFLNSEGGLLIYGAPNEDKKSPDHPFHKDLEPYEKGFLGEHDNIISKISGGIIPMPIGIRLKEIDFQNKSLAVFEIQPSQTKPHQVDNIYQIRIDGQKKPAPHYLIEAMIKQVKFADIRSYIKVTTSKYGGAHENTLFINFNLYLINFSEFQNEKNIRFRLIVDGDMDFQLGTGHMMAQTKKTEYFKVENLAFGEPFSTSFTLSGNFGMISKDKTVLLNIIFHGESCPSKLTVYKFPIKSIGHRGQLEGRKAKLDIDNILFSEHQRSLGLTHEESLKRSLGIEL